MTLWEMLEKSKETLEKLNIETPPQKVTNTTGSQTKPEGNIISESTGAVACANTGNQQSAPDLSGLTELQKAITDLQKNMQAMQAANLAANNHGKEAKNESFINILHKEDYYKDIINVKEKK